MRSLLGDLLVAGLLTLTGVAWLVWLRHGTVTTRATLTEAAAGAAFTLPLLVPTIVAARQSLSRRAGGTAPASRLLVLAPAAALTAALGDQLHRAASGTSLGSPLTATLDVAAQLLVVLVPVAALLLLAGRTPAAGSRTSRTCQGSARPATPTSYRRRRAAPRPRRTLPATRAPAARRPARSR